MAPFLFGGRGVPGELLDAIERAVRGVLPSLGSGARVERKKRKVEALLEMSESTALDAAGALLEALRAALEAAGARVLGTEGPVSASQTWRQAGGLVPSLVGAAMERGYDAAGARLLAEYRGGRYALRVEAFRLGGRLGLRVEAERA